MPSAYIHTLISAQARLPITFGKLQEGADVVPDLLLLL